MPDGPIGAIAVGWLGLRTVVAYLEWRLRLPGGGRRYAIADDRWRMARGQIPRFAVTAYPDAVGDIRLPPTAGVSDEQRRALGLPSAAERRDRIEEGNRSRATARWAETGLPPRVTVARVWRDIAAADLVRRWEAAGAPVWREGDDLVLVHRADAEGVHVFPGLQFPMWRVEDDLWALMVRVRDLDRAAVGVRFVPTIGGRWVSVLPPDQVVWRGPSAPAAPPRADPLAGEVREVALDSRALGGPRSLTVYLPPGLAGRPPVVYLADGGSVPGFAAVLEPAIASGSAPAAVLVGVHCAFSSLEDDARGREYLPGRDRRRFEAHRRLFMDEVPAWAERELGVDDRPERRAVAGFSNGAVLATTLGCRYPHRYGSVIAFSLGIYPPLPHGIRPARHHLVAGTLEEGFCRATSEWAGRLRAAGVEVEHRERVCGHDPLMWEEELPAAIAWAFTDS